MDKFKDKYRIEPNRWHMWDYSSPGSYFLTICIDGRDKILGNIKDKKMILSDAGRIVSEQFKIIPTYHKRIQLKEWVIMPNHVHCIIRLRDYDFDNGRSDKGEIWYPLNEKIHAENILYLEKIREFSLREPFNPPTINEIKQYRKLRRRMLIPKIMGKFQMQTSKQINHLNNTPGHKTWQSDYYDHVIRNYKDHQRIKHYIINNPANWEEDEFFNPNNKI